MFTNNYDSKKPQTIALTEQSWDVVLRLTENRQGNGKTGISLEFPTAENPLKSMT